MHPTPAEEPLLLSSERKSRFRCQLVVVTIIVTLAISGVLIVFFKGKLQGTNGQNSFEWAPPSPSLLGSFDHYAFTTDHTLCAHAGKTVMAAGGNAADAAIAAMFCLGATNPQSSGLGGGFLMTLYNSSTGRCTAIDAREAAPGLASRDMFVNNSESGKFGFLAAAVPGELAGYWEVYKRFGSGKVQWAQLVQPTIDMVQAGVPVSPYLAKVMKDFEARFHSTPSLKLWIDPATNQTYKEGERMPRTRLLRTLKKLASAIDPVHLFYHGEFAETIDREMRANGGIIRKEDLAAYKVRMHETPLVAHLKNGLEMCGGPPPSGFAVTQLIVNLMSQLYPNSTSQQLRTDPKVYHHLIEAQKFAYALRSQLGDQEFVPSAEQLAKRMLTPEFLDSVLKKITDTAHESAYYGADNIAASADFGTSHVSVLDSLGNGVSATTTINRRFGASVESEALGIIWNDEMGDFSTPGKDNVYGFAPSEQNFIAPGKRPMSSMCPLVVYDNDSKKVRMVAGGSGGSMIISAVAKTVVRSLLFGETVKEAIDAPQLHNQYTPDVTMTDHSFPQAFSCEKSSFDSKLFQELREILSSNFAQNMSRPTNWNGIVQAIYWHPGGKIEASGDSRRKTDQTPAGL